MSRIDADAAYLRTEQVVLLGEGEPAWTAAVSNTDLRAGALAVLPFLMKRLDNDEWERALHEARVFQRRIGGKG